jgi:hypothetical protein
VSPAACAAALLGRRRRRPGAQLGVVLDEGEVAVVVTPGEALERAHGDTLSSEEEKLSTSPRH